MEVSSYYRGIANSYSQWNAAVENPIKGVACEIVEGRFEMVSSLWNPVTLCSTSGGKLVYLKAFLRIGVIFSFVVDIFYPLVFFKYFILDLRF